MTLYHRAADMLERAASTMDEEMVKGTNQEIIDMNSMAAELRAAGDAQPVAWMRCLDGDIPLYEHPPAQPRQPLSDDDIDEIWGSLPGIQIYNEAVRRGMSSDYAIRIAFGRAIERAITGDKP